MQLSSRIARAVLGGLAAIGGGAGLAAVSAGAPAAGAATPALTVTLKWAKLFGPNTAIAQSSPTEATLDGAGPSVVVGSRMSGCVYALQLADGTATPGWGNVCTGSGVDSTPSLVPQAGGTDAVVVTSGQVAGLAPPALNPGVGGIEEVAPTGGVVWHRTLPDVFGTYGQSPPVVASPAVGDTGTGAPSIVVGDVGLSLYSLDPATGATEPGWPQRTADTTFATAAIANIGGIQGIVAASDSTAGSGALDNWNGGSVRRMSAGGQTLWTDASNEVVTSGAAVGNLTGAGPVAVYGHGNYWNGSDQDAVTAVDAASGALEWDTHLGGYTLASPALADLQGNGQLDVVEPTWRTVGQPVGGTVNAIGPGGNLLWAFSPPTATTIAGSVATADFGSGYQDVVAATGAGWYILDGRTGAAVAPAQGLNLQGFGGDPHAGNLDMQNAPLVVPDPSGTGLDVVLAGTFFATGGDTSQGFMAVYQVTGTGVGGSVGSGAWPQFRGNAQLTGSTIAPAPPPGTCPTGSSACAGQGYLLAAADGGLFAYGTAGYHGSVPGAGAHVTDVVGIAPTPDRGGYWMVGSDGGIFAFGDAAFRGSMGGQALDRPVVGMAVDPATGGYWEVASDGGIFAFGAPFHGSMGGQPLAQPIVGIAATADGGGYWEVASDGGIFAFGDAAFHGSMGGHPLASPVVGMALDPATGGYWEVAADGGIFAFGAPFFGSMGGRPLNRPVVALSATADGGGYWEVASDGGIFNFGDAYFRGSAGDIALVQPVVGMATTG